MRYLFLFLIGIVLFFLGIILLKESAGIPINYNNALDNRIADLCALV